MEFARNLDRLLREKGVSAYRMSKETGLAQSLISDWRAGKSVPGGQRLMTVAAYFAVSADQLLGGGEPEPARIPVLGVIRAGLPVFAEENIESYELAGVKHPQDHFYLRVRGDSMIGAGIRDGSLVLLRRQNFADDGQIVACLVDGESATLKRFKRQGDTVVLLPENPDYEPLTLTAQDFSDRGASILGVAVSVTIPL